MTTVFYLSKIEDLLNQVSQQIFIFNLEAQRLENTIDLLVKSIKDREELLVFLRQGDVNVSVSEYAEIKKEIEFAKQKIKENEATIQQTKQMIKEAKKTYDKYLKDYNEAMGKLDGSNVLRTDKWNKNKN